MSPPIEKAGRDFAILCSEQQVAFLEAAVKEADTWEGPGQPADSQWYWIGSLLRDREKYDRVREMIDMIHHSMNYKPTTPDGVGTSSSGSLPDEPEPEVDLAEPFLEIP